jgi:hypothetical protein
MMCVFKFYLFFDARKNTAYKIQIKIIKIQFLYQVITLVIL